MTLPERRILVTGGAGFLGSAVVRQLQDLGCHDLVVPRSRDFDLTTEDGVRRVYEWARPQVVLHLAARVGGIGANQASPGRFLYDNLMMGALTMEYARRAGVEKFVGVGTVCSYPKHSPVPFREEHLWNGYPEETNAPYGLAKRLLLVQGQSYRAQYGFNAIHLLPVNLYGPGDNFDFASCHVIPALIRRCVEARRAGADHVVLWGDGSPTREFLYVDDAAEAIVLAAASYGGPEPVNLGSGREISIAALAALIARLTGFEGRLAWDPSRPNGQPRRCLDVSRAVALFGFRARVSLEEGLRRTIEWWETVGGR